MLYQFRNLIHTFLLLIPLALLILLPACGKKDQPTLRGFEKPVPPTSLNAIHRENRIILSWHYPAGREKELADFIVLKSSDSIFRELAHLEKSSRSYEEMDFETGKDYVFKVVARNVRGNYSDDSNIVTVSPLTPPPPPSNLSYTIRDNSVLLSWNSVGEGILYNVYRRFDKEVYGILPVNSSPLTETSFIDTLEINRPVFFTVRSLRAAGIRNEGAPPGEIAVDPSELLPAPPKNVRYYPSPGKIFLSWDEQEEPWVTGFRIYRRTDGKEYQLLGETQIPTFIDLNPAHAKSDYRVNAVGPSKEGPGTEILGVSVPR